MTRPDDLTALESAVPAHLRSTPAAPARAASPLPYPTFVARFRPSMRQVVMCYLGVQCRPDDHGRATRPRQQIRELLNRADGPAHWDESVGTDGAGYATFLFAAYWPDPRAYAQWAAQQAVAAWWVSPERTSEGIGYFREVFAPDADGFETHFSTHRTEGVAALSEGMSGEIREHAYWGSARDRIARSQREALLPSGKPDIEPTAGVGPGLRVRVRPHDNLCLIRSGQDWSDSDLDERALYDTEILPHLEAGMKFLAESGDQVGCYGNRFVRTVDAQGAGIDKSYGMSLWHSLGSLESWASHHPTHLAIFSAGVAYMRKLGASAGLRTYHEVSVLRRAEQSFEYVNCHPRTGMLGAVDLSGTT